ncbi:hypothetical protein [Mesorhizobium sp. B1-1-8]|uniref:hypothetical protein n=1 Tax=Mesorhizobium sp. B1-1-8 TaxID=2589976 RepID=UPI0011269C42|nr:hypothetical protein [Mesorhizobium sp. B1-1-8]UCI07321.1 hypothetical protein FJ974_26645 [Mesorhizobium sp. B1-1-8]
MSDELHRRSLYPADGETAKSYLRVWEAEAELFHLLDLLDRNEYLLLYIYEHLIRSIVSRDMDPASYPLAQEPKAEAQR